MSEIKAIFLGKEYLFPSQLQEYVHYLKWFEPYYEKAMKPLLNQMQNMSYSGSADVDFIYFRKPLVQISEGIIQNLAQQGIYDVTVSDLVDNNTGYIKLHQVCTDTFEEMKEILIQAINDRFNGMNNAYSNATSNITGSGISIWTSSVSSALLYTALESSTIKKQVDKADKEYRQALASLNERNTSNQERKEKELKVKKYYPDVAAALGVFVSELFDIYINALERKGVFDSTKIAQYNLNRSSDILNNVDLVSDKQGVIKQAYVSCPYNVAVFMKSIEYGLIDEHFILAANLFGLGQTIAEAVDDFCLNNKEKLKEVKNPIKALAKYRGCAIEDIYKTLYSEDIKKIRAIYDITNYIDNSNNISDWVQRNISDKVSYFVELSDDAVREKVENYISQVVRNGTVISLLETGAIKMDDIIPIELKATSIQEVNILFSKKFADMINQYKRSLTLHVEKGKARVDELTAQSLQIRKIFDSEMASIESKLSDLKRQRKEAGLFAFTKKKELDSGIKELENIKNNNKTWDEVTKVENELNVAIKEKDKFL